MSDRIFPFYTELDYTSDLDISPLTEVPILKIREKSGVQIKFSELLIEI